MKFLNINATISVKPQFSGEVLKAGTPLDISGNEANSDAAVGIVASDTAVGAESIALVTEGTIDLTELTASYGSALTDECIAALKGITFLYGGKAVVPSGGGLPDYSEASDGDVLSIDNGAPAWKAPSGADRFIVTFTPTSPDFSGTMDKTVAEIYEAYSLGKDIWFSVTAQGHQLNLCVAEVKFTDGYDYPTFNASTIIGPEITGSGYAILQAGTGETNDGTDDTYFTNIYPLTSE